MLRILAVASILALSLAACGTTEETWLAALCRDAGHRAGTTEFERCVESRRTADVRTDDYWRTYHGT